MFISALMVAAEAVADGAIETAGVVEAANRIDSVVDKLKADNLLQLEQLKGQEELLRQGEISINQYEEKVKSLKVILNEQSYYLEKFSDDYAEYRENTKKYIFKTRAKKFFPYLYALAAASLSSSDAGEKALYALAGYGGGRIIEDTGYGLAGATTYIGAKLNLFEVKF